MLIPMQGWSTRTRPVTEPTCLLGSHGHEDTQFLFNIGGQQGADCRHQTRLERTQGLSPCHLLIDRLAPRLKNMNRVQYLARMMFFFSLLITMPSGARGGSTMSSNYGKITRFRKDVPIQFPEFSVTYRGSGKMPPGKNYPRPIEFEEFEIVPGSAKAFIVKWSAGTGDIGPAVFKVDSIEYWLELRTSEQVGNNFGVMKNDEMIVRPSPRP